MENMLDNQYPAAAVDDDGDDAGRITRLHAPRYQIGQVNDKRITADERCDLPCHRALIRFLFISTDKKTLPQSAQRKNSFLPPTAIYCRK